MMVLEEEEEGLMERSRVCPFGRGKWTTVLGRTFKTSFPRLESINEPHFQTPNAPLTPQDSSSNSTLLIVDQDEYVLQGY